MMKRLYILIMFLSCVLLGHTQSSTQLVREGNKLFHGKHYAQAEIAFRKALQKNNRNAIAKYNLGRTYQAENKSKEALEQYKQAASQESNNIKRASSYYNSGTIYQHQRQYDKAIEAYKNALRNNPNHSKARYNLELCKQQQQKQNKNNKGGGKDNNKDKQKQNKDKNKNNQQNKNKDQQKQDNDMSKDNAQRLLDAAMQQEKATQDRLSKAMRQPSNKQLDKNW